MQRFGHEENVNATKGCPNATIGPMYAIAVDGDRSTTMTALCDMVRAVLMDAAPVKLGLGGQL